MLRVIPSLSQRGHSYPGIIVATLPKHVFASHSVLTAR
jgi:hypothetical protein